MQQYLWKLSRSENRYIQDWNIIDTMKRRLHIYIINKAFVRQDLDNVEVLGKEVPLSAVPEWANLEETVTIINVKKPLFAYFKIPNANNVDDSSPLGVSVYSRAVDDIKEADYQWTRILWEFEGSELAIDGDVSLFKRKENGEFDLPKGKERLFPNDGF